MNESKEQLWERFQRYYTEFPSINLAIDLSRMDFADDYLESMEEKMQKAFTAMAALERGAIANPDENRMVGHYWLRNPALAPTSEIRKEIEDTLQSVKTFAAQVHSGEVRGQAGIFKNLLVIGIGGSALGPQFVSRALGHPKTDKVKVYFLDNTDPDGIERVLSELEGTLGQTLSIVISKSGSTVETRNGMIEAKYAYESAGFDFSKHALAITGEGSKLDNLASSSNWLRRFPMWDWVGGRTSELSAVGLLPAAMQGIEIESIVLGAASCDEVTRIPKSKLNPAAMLALAWFHSGKGRGLKDMVILPYKDRLDLLAKYLQQLIMESLGKELDIHGKRVNQGISVFGNKGATDQHSYIQQLRDGINNFFAVFIEVLQDKQSNSISVNGKTTSGDYLQGFLLGTRRALCENGRESILLTVNSVSPFTVGVLIALFERAVGFYANLIEINAYHQPGVEAGKRAAEEVISIKTKAILFLESHRGVEFSALEIAAGTNLKSDVETIYKICDHLAANIGRNIAKIAGHNPVDTKFKFI